MRKLTERITCSLVLADLSGFTQLLYQAARSSESMELVLNFVQRTFSRSAEAAASLQGVQIINTTGDGFLAMVQGPTPSRTAVAFARAVRDAFHRDAKHLLTQLSFRHRLHVRIALHHGTIYRLTIQTGGDPYDVYVGDDINLLARVVSTQTAHRFAFAITGAFHRRLMLLKNKDRVIADEVILDRNHYPEPILVFRLPSTFPEYAPKNRLTETKADQAG